jgi:hypothetical protein
MRYFLLSVLFALGACSTQTNPTEDMNGSPDSTSVFTLIITGDSIEVSTKAVDSTDIDTLK